LTISVSPAGAGTVAPPSGRKYDPATLVTLTPAAGYTFSAWSEPDGASVVANKVTMDKDKSVTAIFAHRCSFCSH
jgi:uncharacterized repeat protein (TIGR02543 family)